MRPVLAACVAAALAACARPPMFHPGPTGLSAREQRALLAAGRGRPGGFERFWRRASCRPGLVKWSPAQPRSVADAPPTLAGVIREEIGRVNRGWHEGETVFVTVAVFEWERRLFGRGPRVGYELVGRDPAGQVVFLAEDRMASPRESAVNLAETDEILVAREIGRKLRKELGR
jgi:hypothetical protein